MSEIIINTDLPEHTANAITEAEALVIQAEKDAIEAQAQAKAEALKTITVTTTNGNTFDGDETARTDMVSAIMTSSVLNLTEHAWKMANNTWVVITIDELKEALALSIQRKGEILTGGI